MKTKPNQTKKKEKITLSLYRVTALSSLFYRWEKMEDLSYWFTGSQWSSLLPSPKHRIGEKIIIENDTYIFYIIELNGCVTPDYPFRTEGPPASRSVAGWQPWAVSSLQGLSGLKRGRVQGCIPSQNLHPMPGQWSGESGHEGQVLASNLRQFWRILLAPELPRNWPKALLEL